MAWTPTNASAWGELDVEIGVPAALNAMSISLASIGFVKENSFSIETEEGNKMQWYGTGHDLIDELRLQGTMMIKLVVKNLNLDTLSKFWNVTEVVDNIEVTSMTTSDKFSVKISSKVSGSEVLEIPYCSVFMKATFAEESGYEQEVEFTILRGAADAKLFTISQLA